MAKLTDEEKAKRVASGVDEISQDETTTAAATDQTTEEQLSEEEATTDETPPNEAATEETTQQTFTKQFSNLKGDSWEEYGKNLETAYDNSFKEALRIKKQLDDNAKVIDEAKKIIAGSQTAAATPPAPTSQTAAANAMDLSSLPEIQYIKSLQQNDMITAFDKFAKDYPQAREQDNFDRFQKASDGVNAALSTALGRTPTYPELFKGIAQMLSWQSASNNARRDTTIKDNAASSQTVSSTVASAKQPTVTAAQVDVYLRMYPNKDRATAVKELSNVS